MSDRAAFVRRDLSERSVRDVRVTFVAALRADSSFCPGHVTGCQARPGAPRLGVDRPRRGGPGLYGFVATAQPDPHFGRILAAYGGVFVAGSLAWGMVADGFRPDRYDVIGALICLAGVAIIMYAPRSA
jgi:hypothetical protein